MANEVALPLIETWSGVPANKLAPAVGASLPGSILHPVFESGKYDNGAGVCGYNREMPEKPSVWHVYPKNGVSTLCENLAEGIENSIRPESRVKEILVENEKVYAVR